MDFAVTAHDAAHHSGKFVDLPKSLDDWPAEAKEALREVLGELDGWCRRHDWPRLTNSWIAEEAVRQGWRDGAAEAA